ncbi:MAG: uroporphyrinogen-III synthase [Anaerolineae bacterium]|nr:uroporphyrinogen-III synthase [Anaerolineae bacterium]
MSNHRSAVRGRQSAVRRQKAMSLQGQRIVITRSEAQAEPLARPLRALGGEIIYFPTIQLIPLETELVAAARQQVTMYDWLLFTSQNGVTFFLTDEEMVARLAAASTQIAAVGPATAHALTNLGLSVQFIPESFTGEWLAVQLGGVHGQKILLPRSRLGRQEIVIQLRAQRASVTDLPVYDTIAAQPSSQVRQQLAQGVDMITFTSPSTVQNFCQMVPEWPQLLSRARVVCIGPVTAAAATRLGLTVSITALEHTAEGLIQAIKQG